MLSKCMSTPLKLARLMEWNGRLGKPSAIMAIDIANHHIGIALAYHRQHSLVDQSSSQHSYGTENRTASDRNETGNNSTASTTSLTALPPIPYMSHDPYHPSYAFLHHHGPNDDEIRSLDRAERTMEIADQLAQLAHDRKVKGILVRWPGDLASAVSGSRGMKEQSMGQVEEGHLLFSTHTNTRNGSRVGVGNGKSDGSMGYMRGRILYALDKCLTNHGHNQKNVHSEPLIVEGSRPFALWDTSRNERNWITYKQQNKHSKAIRPLIPKREDKFGNPLTEMDPWGRAAIFGNQPPQPMHGKFYYSSKQQYSGYDVSSQFEVGSSVDGGKGARNPRLRNENFDSLHDNESRMGQFQGSLSAMHALHDFAQEHLQGRIALPLWASTAASVPSTPRTDQSGDDSLFNERPNDEALGYRANAPRSRHDLSDITSKPTISKESTRTNEGDGGITRNNLRVDAASSPTPKKPNGLASLVQMPKPKRKARKRGKRGV